MTSARLTARFAACRSRTSPHGLAVFRRLNWPNTEVRFPRVLTTVAKALRETGSVSRGLSPVTRSTRPSRVLTSSTASCWLRVLSKTTRRSRGKRFRSQYPVWASRTTRSERLFGLGEPFDQLVWPRAPRARSVEDSPVFLAPPELPIETAGSPKCRMPNLTNAAPSGSGKENRTV